MSEREFDEYLRQLSEHLGRRVRRDELAGELRDHLDEHFDELIAEGVPRDEAVRRALDEFGAPAALAAGLAAADRIGRRRRAARWSGATIVVTAASLLLLWAMWPERARVPLAPVVIAQTESPPAAKPGAAGPAVDRLPVPEPTLRKTLDVDFQSTPLRDVVAFLNDAAGDTTSIEIDVRDLEGEGVAADIPVTLRARKTSLEHLLNRLAVELDIAWTYRDEVLSLTSRDTAANEMLTQVYEIRDLLPAPGKAVTDMMAAEPNHFQQTRAAAEVERLIDAIQHCFGYELWQENGGSALATVTNGSLVVTHNWHVQRKIAAFLDELRRLRADLKAADRATDALLASRPARSAAEAAVREKLSAPVACSFAQTPLQDVVEFLAEKHGLPIGLDRRALEDEGIGFEQPVDLTTRATSLESALNRIARQCDLTWIVRDEAVQFTSQSAAEEHLTTRIYPTLDLVAGGDDEMMGESLESLAELIRSSIDQDSGIWLESGGAAVALPLPQLGSLVVFQTDSAHRKIERLLRELRTARRDHPEGVKPIDPNVVTLQVYSLENVSDKTLDLTELEALIREMVEPESWNRKEASLRHLGQRLIVKQTPAVQRKVRRFLALELGLPIQPPGGVGGGGMMGGAMGGMGGGFF